MERRYSLMKNSKSRQPIMHGLASSMAAIPMGTVMVVSGARAADTSLTLATSYQSVIQETTDAAGFIHAGVESAYLGETQAGYLPLLDDSLEYFFGSLTPYSLRITSSMASKSCASSSLMRCSGVWGRVCLLTGSLRRRPDMLRLPQSCRPCLRNQTRTVDRPCIP